MQNLKNLTISASKPGTRIVKLNELEQGTIIETDPTSQEEDLAEDEEHTWWTREQLLKNVDKHPFGEVEDDEDISSFEMKVLNMTKLTNDGQVWKRILRNGKGPLITKKNAIVFHLTGWLDGATKPFDSTILPGFSGKPINQRLDEENVLPGLMVGLLTMKLYEKAEILIEPEYAFGKLGCPPRVPGNSTILYIVEILEVYEEGTIDDFNLMTAEEISKIPYQEILNMCDEQRNSGNTYFKGKKFKEAAVRYRKTITFLEGYVFKNQEDLNLASKLLAKLYCNIAITYLELNLPKYAIINCKKTLQIEPNNAKALFNYGKAKFNMAEYEEARSWCQKAAAIIPDDPAIIRALMKIDKDCRKQTIAQKNLYRRMASAFCG